MSLLKGQSTTEILTNNVISGYVYADAIRDGVQRLEWVLFENFQYVNDATMTLRAVTDTTWRHDSLASFVQHVQGSHAAHPGWTFCHARAVTTINTQARIYELQPGPPRDDFQLEGGRNVAILSAGTSGAAGMCYARIQSGQEWPITEYWNLSNDCQPAPDSTIQVEELNTAVTVSVGRSVKIDNRYDKIPPVL